MFLKILEASLLNVAVTAASSPTGGMLAYLNDHPEAAMFYVAALNIAHSFATSLEGNSVATPPAPTPSQGPTSSGSITGHTSTHHLH